MPLALTTDILLESVGKRVKNTDNTYLGEIIEIFRNAYNDKIEYAILKTNQLFDQEERFFAIPVSATLIKITEAGEIVLLINKDDLHFSTAIPVNKCPSPNFQIKPYIFEILGYKVPA